MKFLVTGATGFIGKSLVNLLLDQGHSILAISRTENFELQQDKITWIQSSLQLNESAMDRIREFEPEVLIHLAWEKIPDFSYETSVPENQGITPFGFHFNLPPTITIEE